MEAGCKFFEVFRNMKISDFQPIKFESLGHMYDIENAIPVFELHIKFQT